MIHKVLKTIKKHQLIENSEKIIVGLSGGPDSACLLYLLKSISATYDLKITAVHVNHMLRGNESDEDQKYAEELCRKLGIELFVEPVDIKSISKEKGISLEEAGREARYEKFFLYAKRVGAFKIAVGHNKNDQVETVLMRIIRGTGLDGLKGMDYKRGMIVRPLLDIERSEIEAYCKANNLNPRTDSSNLESVFTRNKVRLELIPTINRLFNMNINDNVFKLSRLLKDENDFIENRAVDLLEQCVYKRENGQIDLSIEKLKDSHIALVRRSIRSAVKEVKGDLKGIETVHIDSIVELAFQGRTGAEVQLPSDIRVRKSYGVLKIFIYRCDNNALIQFEKPVDIVGDTRLEGAGVLVRAQIEEIQFSHDKGKHAPGESNEQIFDYEKLGSGINIRNRRNGDTFKPLKSMGTKKLKEYFIDHKIPREERDGILLVAKGNEIVWIIGHKISDKFKVTDNTKRVLKLKYIDAGNKN